MTDRYNADQLERELNATVVAYRLWLNKRDQWTSFEDDVQRDRLRQLADEVSEVVRELTADQEEAQSESREGAQSESAQDEFDGKVETSDGASFETFSYFEDGEFVVADDDDEEWVVSLDDISREKGTSGVLFPDNDGSQLQFVPEDPDAFFRSLEQAQKG